MVEQIATIKIKPRGFYKNFYEFGIYEAKSSFSLFQDDLGVEPKCSKEGFLQLIKNNGYFCIDKSEVQIYYCFELCTGSIIKLGSLKLKVIMMSSDCTIWPQKIVDSSCETDICRICFGDSREDNPLLSLCACTGTVKYVHYICAKRWFSIRATPKCELCLSSLPATLQCDGQNLKLLENYFVLESEAGEQFVFTNKIRFYVQDVFMLLKYKNGKLTACTNARAPRIEGDYKMITCTRTSWIEISIASS